jgi:hypothetical protein
MGHYWSEMSVPDPPRHPRAIDVLKFKRVTEYDCYNQYYHEPCLQMFYIYSTYKLPDAIWRHANECKGE